MDQQTIGLVITGISLNVMLLALILAKIGGRRG